MGLPGHEQSDRKFPAYYYSDPVGLAGYGSDKVAIEIKFVPGAFCPPYLNNGITKGFGESSWSPPSAYKGSPPPPVSGGLNAASESPCA